VRGDPAGVEFLGTSGQNVDDLDMYTSIGDRLDVMETTLRWQHLAPSAPDTLGAPTSQPSHALTPMLCPYTSPQCVL
jgi:DNA polymerase II small subunit/DNA polymerase delta subunit B